MPTSKIINPATNRPFNEVEPNARIINLRNRIIKKLREYQGRYDAAQTTEQNELHWINADLNSPHAANSLAVRSRLRSRSRYETANNGYLLGVQLSLASDLTGSGPSLQITDPRFNEKQRRRIEKKWKLRAKAIRLRQKIWRLRFAKSQDGEGFGFAYSELRRSFRHRNKANFRLFEADQVTHHDLRTIFSQKDTRSRFEVDGIRFDRRSGEPEYYHLLNDHPGETFLFSLRPLDGKWIPVEDVVHWFRRDRSWLRGIPETTSTLPLWALLRRYTLAVVQNAEIAADFTVLLQSMQPSAVNTFVDDVGDPSQVNPEDWFDSFPIDRGLMTVVPSGGKLEQLDPAQPVSIYDSFVNALVREASRPLLSPQNIALGSSGDFNMASANFDRQGYRESIKFERLGCEEDVLDKDLYNWWFEAIRIPGYFEDDEEIAGGDSIAAVARRFQVLREDPPEHIYRWDEVPEHVDPLKVAQAIEVLFKNKLISQKDVQEGRFNRSVEEHRENILDDKKWMEENDMVLDDSETDTSSNSVDDTLDERGI